MLIICLYLSLAKYYGYGRAVMCILNLSCATFAIVFVAAARECYREANLKAAASAALLAMLILAGALVVGIFVFSRP